MAEIIDAVSESLDSTKCQGKGDCHNGEICLTHHLWEDLSEQIHSFLSSISLADLVAKREIEEIAKTQSERYQRINSQSGQSQSGQSQSGQSRVRDLKTIATTSL